MHIVITLDWNRILAGSLAAIYILISLVARGLEGAFTAALFAITPLACIWFSDAMGDYTGPVGEIGITQTSPGIFVCIAGWILLLMPIAAVMLSL